MSGQNYLLVSYEFSQESVFSGNGVLGRSIVSALVSQCSTVWVFCAVPVPSTVAPKPIEQFADVSSEFVTLAEESTESTSAHGSVFLTRIPVAASLWRRLDWKCGWQQFADGLSNALPSLLAESSPLVEAINCSVQSVWSVLFVDYSALECAKRLTNALSTHVTVLHSKCPASVSSSTEHIDSGSVQFDGVYFVFRVFHANSNLEKARMTSSSSRKRKCPWPASRVEPLASLRCDVRTVKRDTADVSDSDSKQRDDLKKELQFYEQMEFESCEFASKIVTLSTYDLNKIKGLFQWRLGRHCAGFDDTDTVVTTTTPVPTTMLSDDIVTAEITEPSTCDSFADASETVQKQWRVLHPPLRNDVRQRAVKRLTMTPLTDSLRSRKYLLCCSRISVEKNIVAFVKAVALLTKERILSAHRLLPVLCGTCGDPTFEAVVEATLRSLKLKTVKFSTETQVRDFHDTFFEHGKITTSTTVPVPTEEAKDDAEDESCGKTESSAPLVLLPFISVDALCSLLSDTALNVHSSLNEPYGMSIIEAAAFGTPSVLHSATSIGAAELLATASGNSFFVADMSDATALKSEIQRVLERREALGSGEFESVCQSANETALAYDLNCYALKLKEILSN